MNSVAFAVGFIVCLVAMGVAYLVWIAIQIGDDECGSIHDDD